MFTGLIEEVGIVKNIQNIGGGRRITISADKIMDDLKIDDSVSTNGVCLTVVAHSESSFDVEAVEETLLKTTLSTFKKGKKVNLERAARVSDRLGGHIVQGHTDTVGTIKSIEKLATGISIWIEFPIEYAKYVVEHGSIAIEGISLTVARLRQNMMMVAIIPHTWKVTAISELQNGSKVNLEFDVLGKYVENFVKHYKNSTTLTSSNLEKYIDQPLI